MLKSAIKSYLFFKTKKFLIIIHALGIGTLLKTRSVNSLSDTFKAYDLVIYLYKI